MVVRLGYEIDYTKMLLDVFLFSLVVVLILINCFWIQLYSASVDTNALTYTKICKQAQRRMH